jgi:N-acetylglucosaminyldiphosphoundecaprenol N-acetyl-beta-D-mannosaminyltransferase
MTLKCFGFSFFTGTQNELIVAINKLLSRPGFHRMVTLNPELLIVSQDKAELRKSMQSAELCLADGISMVAGVQLKTGYRLQRLTGVDLLERVLSEGRWRSYFLGASPEVSSKLESAILKRFPKARIVGRHHGYFKPNDWEAIVADIQKVAPEMIWVGMGFPMQEEVLIQLSKRLKHGIGVGVGGAFDVVSGRLNRAPRLIQKIGLEWAYRIYQQPERIHRLNWILAYLKLIVLDRKSGQPK